MIRAVVATSLALFATALIFWLWPDIDIIVARAFFQDGAFWGAASLARAYRAAFYWLPMVVLAASVIVWARGALSRQPSRLAGRDLAFLALSMALGPGLLVNVGLKDHWHRPRPIQATQFGGPMEFRPWWRPDGACEKNCSFVSGEVSTAAWLVAPASLAPPPLRAAAYGLAIIATLLTALGRFAFGGHFLSDALFATFLTWLVVMGVRRFLPPRGRS